MKTKMFKFPRTLIITLAHLLIITSAFAQSPQKMSYQAVIRDNTNTLITSTLVGMKISILQGSPVGSAVYIETQTPTTNANGLASLEIGSGSVVFGTFAGIDWSAGPYYIKTETDPSGGVVYSIFGTSQLMSVPYALYAANGGTPGLQGPTGPTGTAGTNGSVGAAGPTGPTGTAGTVGAAGPTGPTGTAGTAGAVGPTGLKGTTGITGVTGTNGTNGVTGPTGGYTVHAIGETYGGGIVFYVYDGGQHGLIAAPVDQHIGIRWYGGTNVVSRAMADGVGAGIANTALIIASQAAVDGNDFAATLCNQYSVTVGGVTYGDWYLPSKFELNLLYVQRVVVGNLSSGAYWSSTEATSTGVWNQLFPGGAQNINTKNSTIYVRAIRAF